MPCKENQKKIAEAKAAAEKAKKEARGPKP